jgi:hypothetical protein
MREPAELKGQAFSLIRVVLGRSGSTQYLLACQPPVIAVHAGHDQRGCGRGGWWAAIGT